MHQSSLNEKITVEDIIYAYQVGYFPMADTFDGQIYWHSPDPRGVIPLDNIKPPRSLIQSIKKKSIEFMIDSNFEEVIRNCSNREVTWISEEIIRLYIELHHLGYAHSVETYSNGKLVGGLYGVTLGGAFFGESMFTIESNASKAAFYVLADRLIRKGYVLLDSQYINEHTQSLGAIEIPRDIYMILLEKALKLPCSFRP